MAETDLHRILMTSVIQQLSGWFALDPNVYVSGNLLVFFEPGNKRKHVAPDVFVVRGVPHRIRDNFLIWQEGKGPDAVIELTSKSTRKEDTQKKFQIYQNVLRVREYFLCDPRDEYLKPSLQGFRLESDAYKPIEPVNGRLPSEVLGLHLEKDETRLRFLDPAKSCYLDDVAAGREQEAQRNRDALKTMQAEVYQLRRQVAELTRLVPPKS
jgi:Uma2 family endonuclease